MPGRRPLSLNSENSANCNCVPGRIAITVEPCTWFSFRRFGRGRRPAPGPAKKAKTASSWTLWRFSEPGSERGDEDPGRATILGRAPPQREPLPPLRLTCPARRSRERFPAQVGPGKALERETIQSATERRKPRPGMGQGHLVNAASWTLCQCVRARNRPTDRRRVT